MQKMFSRLHRRIDRDLWIPIDERSTSTTLYPGGITTARVEGPPNFLDPHAVDLQEDLGPSPPTYTQVRNASRPEIARLIRTGGEVVLESTVPIGRRGSDQPVMSSNLTDLNDIRHEEIASHIHMDGRLEAIPHYPVYLEAPARYPRRHQSRSPGSIASSSTTTVFISVSQLPGSEPFDSSSPPANMSQGDSSVKSSPIIRPQTSPTNSVHAEATISGPLVAQPVSTDGQIATMSQISWFWDDLSLEYWKPPDRGYYAPQTRPNIRHTIHWSNRQDSRDPDPSRRSFQRQSSPDSDHPPPPPPKDPGYIAHPRNNGRNRYFDRLRQRRSGPLRFRKDR